MCAVFWNWWRSYTDCTCIAFTMLWDWSKTDHQKSNWINHEWFWKSLSPQKRSLCLRRRSHYDNMNVNISLTSYFCIPKLPTHFLKTQCQDTCSLLHGWMNSEFPALPGGAPLPYRAARIVWHSNSVGGSYLWAHSTMKSETSLSSSACQLEAANRTQGIWHTNCYQPG